MNGSECELSHIRLVVVEALMRLWRLINNEAVSRVRNESGLVSLRLAHTRVFPFIDQHGVRVTEVASKMEVSKQAASKLIGELVEMGALEWTRDPSDARAKLIRFKPGALNEALSTLRKLEACLSDGVSESDWRSFVGVLDLLLARLEGEIDTKKGDSLPP